MCIRDRSGFSLIPERVGSGELVSELSDIYVGETWIIEDDSPYYGAAVFNGREPVTDESGIIILYAYSSGLNGTCPLPAPS